MNRVVLLVGIVVLFAFAPSADAFRWQQKHLKGVYYCVGQGEGYVWAAVLGADGRGRYEVADIVGWPGGDSGAITTIGTYDISSDGYLVLRFGTGEAEGFMVRRGGGVLLTNAASLFTGACWREK